MSLGVRHLSRRRKAQESSRVPKRHSVLEIALDILIYPVAIAAPLALVPQTLQLYTSHDASSLSLITWSVLGFLNVLWLFYGLVHKELPVVVTNAMLMILNFAIAFGILLYS